jgi:hypothetical protein
MKRKINLGRNKCFKEKKTGKILEVKKFLTDGINLHRDACEGE